MNGMQCVLLMMNVGKADDYDYSGVTVVFMSDCQEKFEGLNDILIRK